MAGILKFMECEKTIKDEVIDTIKDLCVAIAIIPMWYWLSGSMENDLYEPLSILMHYVLLIGIVYATQKSVKLSGKVAYYTHAIISLIAIFLIRLGIPVVVAVVIAVILPESINYLFFKKRQRK